MNYQTLFTRSVKGIGLAFAMLVLAGTYSAQTDGSPFKVAGSNNLYCAGYVQTAPVNTTRRIVGGQEEQDGFLYGENDVVYINSSLQAGQRYAVVRPRGRVNTKWSSKSGLGIYVQEVGSVEVFKVRQNLSIARIVNSCDTFKLGDLIMPWEERTSPNSDMSVPFDRFADPSGKAVGRLFMARDSQEMITRDQIVYVDLGRDNNVSIGDKLTIFRPLGKGNLFLGPNESNRAKSYGFESISRKGGGFSNMAGRKRGEDARGQLENHRSAKRGRPDIRKVVGEGVILNVREKTATVVITRTAQEIHTGDYVEVQ